MLSELKAKLSALHLAVKQCKANDKPNAKRKRRIRGFELGIKHTQKAIDELESKQDE